MQSRRVGLLSGIGMVLAGLGRMWPTPAVSIKGHDGFRSAYTKVSCPKTTTASALKRAAKKAKGRKINKQRHKGK
ncbi:hypothetical protein [Escherichia phage EP_H11]|nr:hypothetical protein [Escherichia phage EP_H11]